MKQRKTLKQKAKPQKEESPKFKPEGRALKIDLRNLLEKGSPQRELIFKESTEEEDSEMLKNLVQLDVFGLTVNVNPQHPILILKDKDEKHTLSVLINPLEAGVALTQSNKSIAPVTPHRFAHELLKSLDLEISRCVFVQIKGSHQYVRIFLKGHPRLDSLKFRADEVMSLVLHLNIPIFASPEFIKKSKVLDSQIANLVENMALDRRIPHKNQSYVI